MPKCTKIYKFERHQSRLASRLHSTTPTPTRPTRLHPYVRHGARGSSRGCRCRGMRPLTSRYRRGAGAEVVDRDRAVGRRDRMKEGTPGRQDAAAYRFFRMCRVIWLPNPCLPAVSGARRTQLPPPPTYARSGITDYARV